MTPLDVLPLIVFAKADAIAGAIGGITRSMSIKDTITRIIISALIGGAVAYYLAPLVTIVLVVYAEDYPEVGEHLIANGRNPIGFFIGFVSMYLTTIVDTVVNMVSSRYKGNQGDKK